LKEFPKRPLYKITKFGKTLKPIIKGILKWEKINVKAIDKIIRRNKKESLYDYY
jgi:DNA-binding HxlR family transcriptional regulator